MIHRHVRRPDFARDALLYHTPSGRRGVVIQALRVVVVKVIGSSRLEYWHHGDCLKLPTKRPATVREIELAVCNGLTINQVRRGA